jgi:Mg2+ and Co2+ transporter CorA
VQHRQVKVGSDAAGPETRPAATQSPGSPEGDKAARSAGLRALLYNADGHDCEIDLDDECLSRLDDRSLLWLDIDRRDRTELDEIARIFRLDSGSVRALLRPHDELYLDNYGDYFQFDVMALCNGGEGSAERALAERRAVHLEFLVGPRWIITVHDEDIPFLRAFRDQDKGETLIGAMSPPALVASLLDWHLTAHFDALADLEAFADRLDEAMLTRSAKRSLLAGVVGLQRRVSGLRRLLAAQRAVFYGLSRPDFAHVVESDSAAHYRALERRFERAVDSVDHARDLAYSSFQLFSTRTAESTNDLVRRLTFITMLLGVIGAIAGIFGMNFETPYAHLGAVGFWSVVGLMVLLVAAALLVGHRKGWF